MTDASSSMRISTTIKAPRHRIYQAFLDPLALAAWQVPDNMRSQVHNFDPRPGGQFRISLTYQNPEDAQLGKTAPATDTFHGRFVQLVPDEKIIEVIEFETHVPGFAGEMTLTVTLADADGGTEVSLLYEHLPPAIRLEDNEAGTRQSLQKLARLVE